MRNMALAAVTFMPLASPAVADTEQMVSDITHQVIGFFGFGADQANNPTDPQPIPEPARSELRPHEIAPVPLADTGAPPRLPAAVAAAPSVETPLHRLFCVEY